MSNQTLGAFGEDLACQYLQKLGYRLLDRNFKNKLGEIDLVAQDGRTVCFVEVKTRRSVTHGQPFEAVHPRKMRKLSQMAMVYLKYRFRSVDILCRFDVVSITKPAAGPCRIYHIKNAFDAVY